MKQQNASVRGGVGFLGLLTLLLCHHQLAGNIDWPWWQLFAPLWVPAVAVTAAAILLAIFRR